MAAGKLLRQLIKSGIEGNSDAFKEASQRVIEEERQKQHHLLANDLERILYGASPNNKRTNYIQRLTTPTDREKNLPLLSIREPIRRLEDVILSDDTRSTLEELLQEHHHSERLASYGLRVADRLLFYGPPGCGKTLTAEVIASELGLPLAIVRIDVVVSSYLGETASNLRKVFDFAIAHSVVLLFDEFDALAKERADEAEHGELKRVVNAVVQMMDEYVGKSVLIAATNHERILDVAIWRRFEETLRFEPPNLEQLRRLLVLKLCGVRREFEPDDPKVTALFKGMSHADVERVLRRAIKAMVLASQEFLSVPHIEDAVRRERPRQPIRGA
jgi:SpoVK/Ycf46/Vps4 family AAA+-type ATPase